MIFSSRAALFLSYPMSQQNKTARAFMHHKPQVGLLVKEIDNEPVRFGDIVYKPGAYRGLRTFVVGEDNKLRATRDSIECGYAEIPQDICSAFEDPVAYYGPINEVNFYQGVSFVWVGDRLYNFLDGGFLDE